MRTSLTAIAAPGRVGMVECSLDLNFLIRDIPFGFLLGGGAVFSNSLQLYFFSDKEKAFNFL